MAYNPLAEDSRSQKTSCSKCWQSIDTSSFNGLNLYASFCVAFAGFFRPGELTWDTWNPNASPQTHVSRNSVKFTADGVIINLPRSKTDQFGKGANLNLSFANDLSCPVKALHHLIDKYPRPPSSPLFDRAIGPFNKRWFSENITNYLLKAGVPDASKYSGHSFRRGAANTAISAGLSLEEVKTLGRWRSDAAKRYLTEDSMDSIKFAISKRLHQPRPPSQQSHTPGHLSTGGLPTSSAHSVLPGPRDPSIPVKTFLGLPERSPGLFLGRARPRKAWKWPNATHR